MSRINVHNVGNRYTIVFATLAACLREVPTSPLKELIVVKDHLLIDTLKEQATVRRVARRFNRNWKTQ